MVLLSILLNFDLGHLCLYVQRSPSVLGLLILMSRSVYAKCVRVRGGLYHLHSTTTNDYLDIQPFLVQAQALALEALKCNK